MKTVIALRIMTLFFGIIFTLAGFSEAENKKKLVDCVIGVAFMGFSLATILVWG